MSGGGAGSRCRGSGWLTLACGVALCACATGGESARESQRAPSSAAGAEARALPPPPVPEIAVDAPALEAVPRAALGAIVEQGIGRLLQRVQVEPAREGGRFIGHRVVAMDPIWADGPVHVGDVVVRLNGTTLESPDKAQQALATLRVASELVVDVLRDGQPVRTHLAIQ